MPPSMLWRQPRRPLRHPDRRRDKEASETPRLSAETVPSAVRPQQIYEPSLASNTTNNL
jgi:hypothetical protein